MRHATPLALAALLATAEPAPAASASGGPRLESLRPLIGVPSSVLLAPDETLLDVAHDQRVGFEAVARLNPGVDPWIPPAGTVVRLPTQVVLPHAAPEGLVINIPEMRLFDFSVQPGPEVVAVAIGDAEDPSPVGDFRIGVKRTNPVWRVPLSIREEKPELPELVAPGPDNPLGDRWMTLGTSSYGIHGTNVRWSIGRIATHGCIRLYEDDMRRVFERTPTGTPVQIVYQPYKWGRDGDELYLEVHPDVYGRLPDRLAAALLLPRALGLLGSLDLERVWRAVEQVEGVPVAVGSLPPRPAP